MSATAPLLALLPPISVVQEDEPREIRGIWISAADLERLPSSAEIAAAMDLATDAGANAVFPPAWARGKTTFPSTVAREALGVEPESRDFLGALLFEAHRAGLEVLPWFEPGVEDEAKRELAAGVVLEACKTYDLDGIVGLESFESIRTQVAALDPDLIVAAPDGFRSSKEVLVHRLPRITAGGPKESGSALVELGGLLEKDGELAHRLRDGPWATDARLPWRGEGTWRPRSSPIDPLAGVGSWTWITPPSEPRFLAMDGGESGHVSWTFRPPEGGNYRLYAWIPTREDLAAHSSYRIAASGSMRTVGIDTSIAKNRGWVYLGLAKLEAGEPIEVARLAAEEKDATKITAAGPLLPLLDRQKARR